MGGTNLLLKVKGKKSVAVSHFFKKANRFLENTELLS